MKRTLIAFAIATVATATETDRFAQSSNFNPSEVSDDASAASSTCVAPAGTDCGVAYSAGKALGPRKCVTIPGGALVTTQLFCPYTALKNAAVAAGHSVTINSGFRTMAEQTRLYNCYIRKNCNNGNLAAKPGRSNHQNGIALDIAVAAQPALYNWLRNNAQRYGFIRAVPNELWHWEHRPGQKCDAIVKRNSGRAGTARYVCTNSASGASDDASAVSPNGDEVPFTEADNDGEDASYSGNQEEEEESPEASSSEETDGAGDDGEDAASGSTPESSDDASAAAGCTAPAGSDCGVAYSNGRALGARKCVALSGGVQITTALYCPFQTLNRAAAAAGITLQVNSGFRTMAEQTRLYNCYIRKNCNNGNLAAKPGRSNHQNGIALDISVTNPRVYNWLRDNASKYGFIRAVASELWHWESHPGAKCNSIVKRNSGRAGSGVYTCK